MLRSAPAFYPNKMPHPSIHPPCFQWILHTDAVIYLPGYPGLSLIWTGSKYRVMSIQWSEVRIWASEYRDGCILIHTCTSAATRKYGWRTASGFWNTTKSWCDCKPGNSSLRSGEPGCGYRIFQTAVCMCGGKYPQF